MRLKCFSARVDSLCRIVAMNARKADSDSIVSLYVALRMPPKVTNTRCRRQSASSLNLGATQAQPLLASFTLY